MFYRSATIIKERAAQWHSELKILKLETGITTEAAPQEKDSSHAKLFLLVFSNGFLKVLARVLNAVRLKSVFVVLHLNLKRCMFPQRTT